MRLSEVIVAWEDYHAQRQSLRPKTILSYSGFLLRFARENGSCIGRDPNTKRLVVEGEEGKGDTFSVRHITPRLCRLWIAGETARSKYVGNNALAALRHLFKYMIAEGYLTADPTATIEPCKAPKSDRQAAPEGDIMKLFLALEGCQEKRYLEYRAKLSLMVYGGLRVCEVCAFRLSDMNRETGQLTIPDGKGGKRRKIYPAPECVAAVLQWGDGKEASAQFAGCEVAVRGWLARLCYRAGVKTITPHQLRHSCATRLMRNNAKLLDLMEFLGHNQLTTTQMYLHATEDGQKGLAELGRLNYAPKPDPISPKKAAKRRRVDLRR